MSNGMALGHTILASFLALSYRYFSLSLQLYSGHTNLTIFLFIISSYLSIFFLPKRWMVQEGSYLFKFLFLCINFISILCPRRRCANNLSS